MSSSSSSSTVNPMQLSLPELNQHKQKLEQEVGQLTDTITKLRVAQQATIDEELFSEKFRRYFVEKPTPAAQKHCEDRSGMINGNIGSLAKVLGEKRQNLEMCMAVMQQKMNQQQQQQRAQ